MVFGVGAKNLELFRVEVKNLLESSLKTKQAGKQHKERASFVDKVSLGEGKAEGVVYDSTLKGVGQQDNYELLHKMIISTFQEQGVSLRVAAADGSIDIESLTPEEATELIADDGYFGIEQTSERIFQLAVGVAGGDAARFGQVRNGMEQGFKEADASFGGALPDISYQTIEAALAKFDNWSAGFAA